MEPCKTCNLEFCLLHAPPINKEHETKDSNKEERKEEEKTEERKEEERMEVGDLFKTRHPQYFRLKYLRGSAIAIEGAIACGKSTMGKHIESYLNHIGIKAKYFPEYVNMSFLNLFLSDMKKYAFSFQITMLCKRIEIYKEAEAFINQENGVAILDRSFVGDKVFALMHYRQGNISEMEWRVYCSLAESEIQFEPQYSIYLDCSIDVIQKRLRKRNNQSEVSSYSQEYLKELSETYEELLFASQKRGNGNSLTKRVLWNADYKDEESMRKAIKVLLYRLVTSFLMKLLN